MQAVGAILQRPPDRVPPARLWNASGGSNPTAATRLSATSKIVECKRWEQSYSGHQIECHQQNCVMQAVEAMTHHHGDGASNEIVKRRQAIALGLKS
eukprot:1149515-Pelagomonas_calceolata.AAC.4